MSSLVSPTPVYFTALECLLSKEGKHPIFLPQQVIHHLQQQDPLVWAQLIPHIIAYTKKTWPPSEHLKLQQMLLQFIGARILKEPYILRMEQWKALLLSAADKQHGLLFDPQLFPPLLWCSSEMGLEKLTEDFLTMGASWAQPIHIPLNHQTKKMTVAGVIVSLGSAQAMYALGKYGHVLLEETSNGFIDKELGLALLKRHNSHELFESYKRGFEYFILSQITKDGREQKERKTL